MLYYEGYSHKHINQQVFRIKLHEARSRLDVSCQAVVETAQSQGRRGSLALIGLSGLSEVHFNNFY